MLFDILMSSASSIWKQIPPPEISLVKVLGFHTYWDSSVQWSTLFEAPSILNPLTSIFLAPLKNLYDQGYVSIINNVGYPNPNRSHFRSTDIWHTASNSNEYLNTGWLGRYFDNYAKMPYNGIEIEFVPLVGFRILAIPSYLKLLADLVSDVSTLKIGPVANGALQRYIKNVQTMTTWVVGQKYITLYGG